MPCCWRSTSEIPTYLWGCLTKQGNSCFSSSAASHCGIYIGDGQFIHATSDSRFNCVKITSFSESYYASHFLTGRRLF